MTGHLESEKATFERHLPQLEKEHSGREWVLVQGDEIKGVFPTFDAVATTAIREFGLGPYLIRQIHREPLRLSTSIMTYG